MLENSKKSRAVLNILPSDICLQNHNIKISLSFSVSLSLALSLSHSHTHVCCFKKTITIVLIWQFILGFQARTSRICQSAVICVYHPCCACVTKRPSCFQWRHANVFLHLNLRRLIGFALDAVWWEAVTLTISALRPSRGGNFLFFLTLSQFVHLHCSLYANLSACKDICIK